MSNPLIDHSAWCSSDGFPFYTAHTWSVYLPHDADVARSIRTSVNGSSIQKDSQNLIARVIENVMHLFHRFSSSPLDSIVILSRRQRLHRKCKLCLVSCQFVIADNFGGVEQLGNHLLSFSMRAHKEATLLLVSTIVRHSQSNVWRPWSHTVRGGYIQPPHSPRRC